MRSSRNWAMTISTLIVVTACYAVMAGALVVAKNLKGFLTWWGEEVQVTAYLDSELSSADSTRVEGEIKKLPQVGSVIFIPREKALGDFRTQLASYAPDLTQDADLLKLIPSSFQIHLADTIPTQEQATVLQSLTTTLKSISGIEEVSYGQEWIEKYSTLVTVIENTLRLLMLIILVATVFVISNAIRASVQNRRDEIVVLEMIGASYASIRGPFLLEGALVGFVSSFLALGISGLAYMAIKNIFVTKLSFFQVSEHLSFLNPVVCIEFIVVGMTVGALASYLCVRRINDGYAGSQV